MTGSLLRRQLAQAGIPLSRERMFDRLAEVREVSLLYHDAKAKSPRSQTVLSNQNEEHSQVRAALDLTGEEPSAPAPMQDCDRLAQPPNMGPRYQSVSGVVFGKIDGKAAQEACERAIRQFPGEVRFKAYLGLALERLNSLERAAVLYREAADQGNAVGQYSLETMYDRGYGVPQSDTEAVKWYRLAADQGDAEAQHSLGFMYDKGHSVQQSYKEAVKWCRLAADQGDAGAQNSLGFTYEKGHGVPQSYKEAVKWYRLAADQGYANAENDLGYMYEYGEGVPQATRRH